MGNAGGGGGGGTWKETESMSKQLQVYCLREIYVWMESAGDVHGHVG